MLNPQWLLCLVFLQMIFFCFRKWLTYFKETILSIQHRFYQVCWQLCEHPRQFSMLLSSGLQVRKSPSSLVLGWLSYQEHDLLRSKMQENGIFSSGSPPMAECVRTLMSARRIRPAKYIFSNFWQFFLFLDSPDWVLDWVLDSPDWVIIWIFEWDIMTAYSQASEHCHNTRGGHKCADVSCPQVIIVKTKKKLA